MFECLFVYLEPTSVRSITNLRGSPDDERTRLDSEPQRRVECRTSSRVSLLHLPSYLLLRLCKCMVVVGLQCANQSSVVLAASTAPRLAPPTTAMARSLRGRRLGFSGTIKSRLGLKF